MDNGEPQIQFPKEGGAVGRFENEAKEKFRDINTLLYAVVVAIVITAISALISVAGIVIDQLHFNNQTYREYSQNEQELTKLEINIQQLQDQINSLKKMK